MIDFISALQALSLDLLLHCGCLFCSHVGGMLEREESSMILKKKDTTLHKPNHVNSPENVVFSSSDIVNILHQWRKTQQLIL